MATVSARMTKWEQQGSVNAYHAFILEKGNAMYQKLVPSVDIAILQQEHVRARMDILGTMYVFTRSNQTTQALVGLNPLAIAPGERLVTATHR